MKQKREIYEEAYQIIGQRHSQAVQEAQRRRRQLEQSLPEAVDLQDRIAKTAIAYTRLVLSHDATLEEMLPSLQQENLRLQQQLGKVLTLAGYPENYLDTPYTCSVCRDTGFDEKGERCACYQQLVRELTAQEFNRNSPIGGYRFEEFQLEYYPDGARDSMRKVLLFCQRYSQDFSLSSPSLLMMGATGLGKTHLSLSIAREVVKKGIDLIISGAGLPKELPEFVKGTKTKIAPIISSARAAKLITKLWRTKHNYVPDMIVIEGPEAGGHLGFKLEELQEEKKPKLEDITKEVIEEMKKVEEETGKKIPVVVAGGIFDGKDIAKFLKLGASGVQMATRFVTTKECDAAEEFKKAYINSKKEDIEIVSSPVGMPGRAIRNTFIEKVKQERPKITKCLKCIQTCDVKTTPYCITRALINAVKGNMENALIFCGSNAYRLKEIVSVHELMQELVQETKQCMV